MHAGGSRLSTVLLFERNHWLGGKAAVLEEHGYRFDMGPTILTLPSVLRRIFAEAGRRAGRLPRPDPARSAMAVLLRRRLACSICSPDVERDGGELERFAPGSGRDGLPAVPRALRAAALHLGPLLLLEAGRLACATCSTREPRFSRRCCGDVLACGLGRSVAGDGAKHRARRARRPDARPLHAIRRLGPGRIAGGALRHRPHADGGGRLVSARRHRRRAGGAGEAGARTGRRAPDRDRRAAHPRDRRRRGCAASRRKTARRFRWRRWCRTADSVRTHRELLGGTAAATAFERRRRYEPACSGVVLYLGLDRRYDHLLHHNFVFSRDPHEEFDAIYRQGRTGPRPDVLPRAPRPATEPEVAPPGGEALYVLVHTPYLRPHHDWKQMLPGYRRVILDKLARTGGTAGPRSAHPLRAPLTPQDIHDRYRVLNGAIYGLASHGKLLGRLQARQPQPGREGAVPRRRLGASGPGHADGADVRLDRGRCARPRRRRSQIDLPLYGPTRTQVGG